MSILIVPIVIGAVAYCQLSDVVDDSVYYFDALPLVKKISVLGLIFSVIFTSVTVALTGTIKKKPKKGTLVKKYPLKAIAAASTDKEKFQLVFPMLKAEILGYLKTECDILDEASEWVDKMLEYSVPGGKLNRGTTVLTVYRSLKGRELTDLEVARASVLGWAIEFLQAFFLVADDVMDESVSRRGQPCWYKLKHVGLIAINDSFLLESFVFTILKTHFRNDSFYPELVELMLDITQKTEVGQLYDLTSQPYKQPIQLERFTEERYRKIVQYKTAYYSFYLPVAMGMRLSRITNESSYELAESICIKMGEYFQIQDDYLDCFGEPDVIGKVGTDIQDAKCSWLVVQALKEANASQRKIIEQNYGRWDDGKVAKIKELYKVLKLEEKFQAYEEESYGSIQSDLDKATMPRDVFEILLKKIYKRSK